MNCGCKGAAEKKAAFELQLYLDSRRDAYFKLHPIQAIFFRLAETIVNLPLQSIRPPGAIDAIRGAREWGRRNGVKPDRAVDIFHDIKQGDSGPASGAKDELSVNPDTGDVFDSQGEHIGNLGDGH